MSPPLLRIQNLEKRFRLEAGLFASTGRQVWALNNVSLDLRRGETYGLVGESGSGKTTLARTVVQLVGQSSGLIEYEGWAVNTKEKDKLRSFRSEVKYVFQDPSSSLDPRMSILRILTVGLLSGPKRKELDTKMGRTGLRKLAGEVLETVGLRASDLDRRPAEFSGGQRQRISLARALMTQPKILICDEVVSALDVSIQGQILNLLTELKRRYDLTILFIAHDLTIVGYMADRVGVLYGGSLMEEATAEALVKAPLHPYSVLLYQSIPEWGKPLPDRSLTLGNPYDPTLEPRGCPFAGRCPLAQDRCRSEKPILRDVAPDRKVACHFV